MFAPFNIQVKRESETEYTFSFSLTHTYTPFVIVSGEVKNFRKFYKFQVVNPLAVKTKVNTLGDGKIMLEGK